MKNLRVLPTISILTATYNSIRTLPDYLKAIELQDYPKGRIELCFGDGGSTDGTLEFLNRIRAEKTDRSTPDGQANGFRAVRIVHNRLKTGESGKAAALKVSTGQYVALVDSDNLLPTKDWLKEMIRPLEEDQELIGSEPLGYSYRPFDPALTRYSALLGMNDPLVHFLGNYDRFNTLTGRWTESPLDLLKETESEIIIGLKPENLPTIGANGTVLRRELMLKMVGDSDYLFDIDEIAKLSALGRNRFAKVKNEIVHLYAGDLKTFARKQNRRVRDFFYYRKAGVRHFTWGGPSRWRLIYFAFACLTVVPLLWQAAKGYLKKPDSVWLLHPIYCEITFYVYLAGFLKSLFRPEIASRETWSQ